MSFEGILQDYEKQVFILSPKLKLITSSFYI